MTVRGQTCQSVPPPVVVSIRTVLVVPRVTNLRVGEGLDRIEEGAQGVNKRLRKMV